MKPNQIIIKLSFKKIEFDVDLLKVLSDTAGAWDRMGLAFFSKLESVHFSFYWDLSNLIQSEIILPEIHPTWLPLKTLSEIKHTIWPNSSFQYNTRIHKDVFQDAFKRTNWQWPFRMSKYKTYKNESHFLPWIWDGGRF